MLKSLCNVRLAMVVLLPLLLALAPAMAQTVVYKGKTIPLSVIEVPGNTYEWEIYSDITVDFAKVPGNCPAAAANFVGGNTGPTVNVEWLELGIYFFKVTARDAQNCAMNFKMGMIKVIPIEIEAIISGATFTGACQQVKLDASKSIGDIMKYEWTLIDQGATLTQPRGTITEFMLSPSYKGTLPADFMVKLQVTDRKGNTDSNIITIKVDQLPVAEVYSTGKLEKDGSMIVDGKVSTGTALNYRWFTSEGNIVGPNNQPTAKLNGPGIYSLEITDNHGCKSTKSFKFPLEIHQIFANDDYTRTSWAKDTTIIVLSNDHSTVKFIPSTMHVIEQPTKGETRVNPDGSITYIPRERRPGRDQFVYEVCDEVGLCAQATVIVDLYDGGITAPEGFSPNGDGINEVFKFKGLVENYPKSQLYVYTRSGQLVYQNLVGYENDWGGTTTKSSMTNLELVPSGTYYYVLRLGVHEIGDTNRSIKGFVYIGY
ncbi:MAG TPA: gliding motility-associated C-terminal domain-containing protein [Prolixibacteraceae bacterium]|jgi:gliding motility-associated-like protein